MNNTRRSDPSVHLFDPGDEYLVTERHLPHWAQSGALCFITWRTWDSMPQRVLETWIVDRNARLAQLGIDASKPNWKEQLLRLPIARQNEFRRAVSERWEAHLDVGHGACVLRKPEVAEIVARSLKHFDGDRYILSDFVVMPNHVHLLVAFRAADAMLAQCESWKRSTATQINRLLGRRGRFWEVDGFDHLVRTLEEFQYLRKYIAGNPRRARLRSGEYVHFAREPL